MKKKVIIPVVQIAVNIFLAAAYFVKFIHYVGILPGHDDKGNFRTFENHYYFSPYENLSAEDNKWLMYLAFGFIVASIVASIVRLIIKNKKAETVSNIVFSCSVVISVIAILFSTTTSRCW